MRCFRKTFRKDASWRKECDLYQKMLSLEMYCSKLLKLKRKSFFELDFPAVREDQPHTHGAYHLCAVSPPL